MTLSASLPLQAPARSASRFGAFARLELADALRSRWLLFTTASYLGVFGLFGWLGLRESSVLGFTGMSRVVLNAANAIVVVLPLVALVATSQTVVRARQSGYFELFLSQPCQRRDWFWATVAARAGVLFAPLLVLLLLVSAVAALLGEPSLAALVSRTTAVTLALLWAYVGLGLLVSSLARSAERAVVLSLLIWLIGAALHDFALIGVLLELRLEPHAVFMLTAANPVEAARLALLTGVDPDLSVLGPVGFWIANALGPRATLLIGVMWPFSVGSGALALALRRLHRSDLVG
ncbi:MAG TPA: ABC transporter permease subunit [Polyangiaceae bacterium]|nr:ABC transporter permease subunit [Polyangiaceae bacterium]